MIKALLILTIVWSCQGLEIVQSILQIRKSMDLYSYMPFLVIYEKDLEVFKLNEVTYRLVESKTKDYCRVFILDCSKNIKLQEDKVLQGCKVLQQANLSIQHIEGFHPSDHRIHIRGKIFQIAPEIKVFQGQLNSDSLLEFANGLLPTYYKTVPLKFTQLYNDQQIINFLNETAKLTTPKVVLYDTSDSLESIQKIMIYFFQRINFALVPFTNQNNRPLILYVYNFTQMKYQKHVYPRTRLGDYNAIKNFLEPYAPKRQLTSYQLLPFPSVKTFYAQESNASRVLYDTQMWTVVYEGPKQIGQTTIELYRNKFSNFLQYVLISNDQVQPKLYFGKDKTKEISLEEPDLLPEGAEIPFARIENNLINLMQIPQTILIVEPSLLHLCSITNLEFFSHFLYCVSTTEDDVALVKDKYKIAENQSLAVLISRNQSGLHTENIHNLSFRSVVKETYWTVFPKIKMMTRMFVANPLFSTPPGKTYSEVCQSFCIIYLHDTLSPNKDQLRALRQASYKYSSQMTFVQSDFRCNHDLFKNRSKDPDKPNFHKVLVLYSNNKIFAYKQKVTLKVIDKMIKQYKIGKLKLKPFPQEARTDSDCPYKMKPIEEILGQYSKAQGDNSESEQSQSHSRKNREQVKVSSSTKHQTETEL